MIGELFFLLLVPLVLWAFFWRLVTGALLTYFDILRGERDRV